MKFVGLFFVSIMLMNLTQLTGFAGDRDLEGSEGDTKFNVYYGSGAGAVNGRDKVSQKWSFKSEPVWKDFAVGGRLVNLIPCWNRRLV